MSESLINRLARAAVIGDICLAKAQARTDSKIAYRELLAGEPAEPAVSETGEKLKQAEPLVNETETTDVCEGLLADVSKRAERRDGGPFSSDVHFHHVCEAGVDIAALCQHVTRLEAENARLSKEVAVAQSLLGEIARLKWLEASLTNLFPSYVADLNKTWAKLQDAGGKE